MSVFLELGTVVITPTALEALFPLDVLTSLERHESGDWGDVCPDDAEANASALQDA